MAGIECKVGEGGAQLYERLKDCVVEEGAGTMDVFMAAMLLAAQAAFQYSGDYEIAERMVKEAGVSLATSYLAASQSLDKSTVKQ